MFKCGLFLTIYTSTYIFPGFHFKSTIDSCSAKRSLSAGESRLVYCSILVKNGFPLLDLEMRFGLCSTQTYYKQ